MTKSTFRGKLFLLLTMGLILFRNMDGGMRSFDIRISNAGFVSTVGEHRQGGTSSSANAIGRMIKDGSEAVNESYIRSTMKSLYVCGFLHAELAKEVFQDYVFQGELKFDTNATLEDILFFGKFGPCKYQTKHFPGKILYLNGEKYDDYVSQPNEFRLGPEPPNVA